MNAEGVIIYGQNGKPIAPRNANQTRMVRSFAQNDLTFALGPAGTGKTYIAIALAVHALKNKQCRKIILSRPAVEAGEKLGFLPGDMKDKIDPYLQPLYDALEDMIPQQKLKEYMEAQTIQIAPLAFMRGRTLNDAVIILDEAQNTTRHQMKMFLTRLGMNGKMIITGDTTQIDLPRTVQSGLLQALRILKGVKGIASAWDNKGDIVIGSDVWIGYEAVILAGVTIGDGAIIGTRAVVTKDVPPYTVAGGVPARPIRRRFPDETVAALLDLKWWDWPVEKIAQNLPAIQSGNVEQLQ